jgi:hypothetical protein
MYPPSITNASVHSSHGRVKDFSAIPAYRQAGTIDVDYFEEQANQLVKIRKSGHPPDNKIRQQGGDLSFYFFWSLLTDH